MFRSLLCLLPLLFITSAHAQWQLEKKQSKFYFTFIKASSVGTVGRFESFDAQVSKEDGKASLTIDLASLNTDIEKRDNRLRNVFFNVTKNPTANVEIHLGQNIFQRLSVGHSENERVSAKVTLNGKTRRLRENVNVTMLDQDTVLVTNTKPVLLNVEDFGLLSGIQALIDLAGVKSISTSVPITFKLLFKKNQ
ncbi:YceI family protein [Endozoicomonas ascidiicola]|uniref:YceI family protein n=1 Tax=Endozoicomonas ascidiicola TaxID=1698521 RepID=UPI0008342CA8|nr:YceI family protein [Endozoicomonas ascidiicola]